LKSLRLNFFNRISMELVKDKFCVKPLENCLRTSVSYDDYMNMVSDLVINESATGDDVSESMVQNSTRKG